MSASAVHERRVGVLTTLGALAGCRAAARLDPGLSPDVVAADHRLRVLFVGDAKATETAGCAATARRLRRYLRATEIWRAAGYIVRVALCASRDTSEWERTLLRLAGDVRAPVAAHGHATLGDDALAWLDLTAATRTCPAGSPAGALWPSAATPTSGLALGTTAARDDVRNPRRGLDRVLVLPDPLDEPSLGA